METVSSHYRKIQRCRTTKILSDIKSIFLLGIIISQFLTISSTLALTDSNDDEETTTNKSNSISGKFFDYMNNLRSASSSSTNSDQAESNNNNNTNSSVFRNIFFQDSSWQDTYQKLLNQVKKVRGMISPLISSKNGTDPSPSLAISIFNSSISDGEGRNRNGRLNGPYSWSFPWMMPPPSSPTSTPRTAVPPSLHHIFFGPFDQDDMPRRSGFQNPSSSVYYPSSGSSGSPSQNHFNYVYKYNPTKATPGSASDLEQHTTTTIYIICICLIIMLVGTILFAFVSKCQEASTRASRNVNNPSSNLRGRRRRNHQHSTTTNSTTQNRPEISIIMPNNNDVIDGSLPPAYPKVVFDPPPAYDELFPVGKQ